LLEDLHVGEIADTETQTQALKTPSKRGTRKSKVKKHSKGWDKRTSSPAESTSSIRHPLL